MNYLAKYLDSGFYTVSDQAAGALCRVLGQKLPKHGWQKFVMLSTERYKLNAWLQRTPTSLVGKRGWVWAVFALRLDGSPDPAVHNSPITLGKVFQFTPIASTVAQRAA